MAPSTPPRLALIPLDERPVNTGLVRDVARIAGARLAIPPASVLPRFRASGDLPALADWVRNQVTSGLEALVASVETLAFGGLIPSRTSSDRAVDAVARLDVLREVKEARPDLRIAAVSVVMRASDSYSSVEEPEYWSRAGREVHALGGAVHRAWAGAGARHAEPPLDDEIRADYASRRLRNHLVGLSALGLAWDGVLDPLIITADDTAAWSAGSAEQSILEYWQRLRGGERVLVYPGADETGAVLAARVLLDGTGPAPRVAIRPGEPEGMELIPAYENVPLGQSVARQLAALGAVPAQTPDDADLILVIHTPDPARGDCFGSDPVPDPAAIEATRRVLSDALASGRPTALADLRYGNGGDIALVEAIASDGTLSRLESYGGWNTAGNALGSTLALGLAAVAGRRRGTLDEPAQHRALRRRVVDDALYQARVRSRVARELFDDRIEPAEPGVVTRAEDRLTRELAELADALLPGDPIASVTLPWRRTFEVDVRFDGDGDGDGD